ncbi:MAG: hypothetical protein ACI9UT_000843 [Flavobacteriales bacterium]|jgi:uncharacterized protein YifE (UPF0438 family)
MAKLTRDSLIKLIFRDAKNYPYGFSRSGDFSISESKALSQYGCLIAGLVDGQIKPLTADDNDLLAAAYGNKDAETVAEKAWMKYQKRINRPKLAGICDNHNSSIADDGEGNVIEQGDIEVKIDDE